jgi:hypothetical protein
MTKDTQNKAIRMPGKERPAASQLVIQKPPTTKPHPRNLAKNSKPSADQLIKPIAEGIEYRFLRSQPRVLGSGSLHRARPRQSEYHPSMPISVLRNLDTPALLAALADIGCQGVKQSSLNPLKWPVLH